MQKLNNVDKVYHDTLRDILENGNERGDRTGTGTISKFGVQMRFDLKEGFPAITTKKLAFGGVTGELLWMIEGSSDDNRLKELSPARKDGRTIWTDNAEADYWLPKAKFKGDLGRVYGVQWRSWRKYHVESESFVTHFDDSETHLSAKVKIDYVDQLAKIIETIKTNPNDRRMVLSAFNVADLDEMALPPCHMFAQFYVSKVKGNPSLSCQMYMRSADMFLGVPFNIASYALLTHMIAQVTDLGVHELILTIGDAHIYKNHIDQVNLQLSRESYPLPNLILNQSIESIDEFTPGDIVLDNYQHHPTISATMAV